MPDITKEPYAEWLERALREMVYLQPESIGIVLIMPDGTTGTQYFHADNRDRLIMMEAIMIDYLGALIVANAESLRELLTGEEGERQEPT